MGLIYANIEIFNAEDLALSHRNIIGEDEVRHLEISCMVDTGAVMLIINEEIRAALGLPIREMRQSRLADNSPIELPVAGPVEVRYAGRFCTTNALVLPGEGEPLLGAIPMEEMDLWVNPNRQMLTPVHPEGPVMMLKGVR